MRTLGGQICPRQPLKQRPKSLLAQAIDHALSRLVALNRSVDDGRLQIDNNFSKTAFVPPPLAKNFLFISHPEAGQRSAVIYSVLGSCRRHGINPAEYLQDVFDRLPKAKTSEVKSLTPAARANIGGSISRKPPEHTRCSRPLWQPPMAPLAPLTFHPAATPN
jgi:hypothetical protein